MTFVELFTLIKRRALIIAIIGMLAGYLVVSGCGKQSSTGAPQGGPPEVGIVVVQPQRVALTTELPGRTSAYLIAEVRPQVGGIIQKRLFTEGSDVQAGDVLYQIDPSPFEAAHNSALANLDAV